MADEEPSGEEKRKYPRKRVNLRGRYMLASREEFPCTIIDVSAGGIAVAAPKRGEIGEQVIVYLDELGRAEGEIVRFVEGGFALQLTVETPAAVKFAMRLEELHNGGGKVPERRRELRVKLNEQTIAMTPAGALKCEIVDLSLTGASVNIQHRPPVGTIIKIGRVRGRVVRHSATGVAIEFVDVAKDTAIDDRLTDVTGAPARDDNAAA